VDDTDGATVANVGPVYDFLYDHGFFTTKTVWPLAATEQPITGGSSLEDAEYRSWILALRQRGFEIALHGAADHTSSRERVRAALDYFREVIGDDPRLHANHVGQREGLYWGEARLDGLAAAVYRAAQRIRKRDGRYFGHHPGSDLFWGDLCLARIGYVRNFTFRDINTTRADSLMPYHDPRRPYARYWFSCSEGSAGPSFCGMVSERNQDRLVAEGGGCIMYTHLAYGFLEGGRVRPEFARLMKRLSRLPGWFVPASTMLDHLRSRPSWRADLNAGRLRRMQWRWLLSKLRHGTS
jgi:hypothetical protein